MIFSQKHKNLFLTIANTARKKPLREIKRELYLAEHLIQKLKGREDPNILNQYQQRITRIKEKIK